MTGCASQVSQRSRLRWLMMISAVGSGCGCSSSSQRIAADRGIHRFDAEVMANNGQMLGVFEHAGFAVRRWGSEGELTVSLDITPTAAVRERIDERDHIAAIASLRGVFAPSSIAVVGAAATRAISVGRCSRASSRAALRVS